ncbi:MAG: hypothetical protein ABUL54_10310 [Dongia sp.]|jgi:hypothetical protein
MVKGLILMGIMAVALAKPAVACTCPKEQLIKQYGTVSMLGGLKTQAGPVRPAASQTAATVKTPSSLPLLVPIRQTRPVGPASLEWLLLEP